MCEVDEVNCTTDTNIYEDNSAKYGKSIGNYPQKIIYSLDDPDNTGASISADGS